MSGESLDWNTVLLTVIALSNLLVTILSVISHRNVRKIEIATNSMKDRLVASTAAASHAEGLAQGLAERPPGAR